MNKTDSAIDILIKYNHKKPVIGCFPLYPPVELFASMGLLPVVMWNLKASVSDLAESDKHLQNYSCSIARELTQFVLSESGQLLDGIFSYNACDTLRNMPEILVNGNSGQGRNVPMFRMHISQVNREYTDPQEYFKNEIELLIQSLEKAFDTGFSRQQFKQTVEKYANLYALYRKLETQVSEGRLSFGDFSGRVLTNYFLPIEEQIKNAQNLNNQIRSEGSSPDIGVVISGIMPPPPAILESLESCGLKVVGNDIASMNRSYAYSPPVTDDPVEYYTDLFINRFPCTTLLYQADDRLKSFLHLVHQTVAKGVVFCGEKFCEYEYFEFPYLEKQLNASGTPSLFLEFGIDDVENVSSHITRIEAFAEMLHQ